MNNCEVIFVQVMEPLLVWPNIKTSEMCLTDEIIQTNGRYLQSLKELSPSWKRKTLAFLESQIPL